MGEKEKVCVTVDLRFLNKERRGRESEDACEKERERERERRDSFRVCRECSKLNFLKN